MASSDNQIDKAQRGRPKRAELPDVNINTGVQSIHTERAFLKNTAFSDLALTTLLSISQNHIVLEYKPIKSASVNLSSHHYKQWQIVLIESWKASFYVFLALGLSFVKLSYKLFN